MRGWSAQSESQQLNIFSLGLGNGPIPVGTLRYPCEHVFRSEGPSHRQVALRTTPAQRRRCYGLLRSAGDVWAWVIDCNRQLREWHCPQVVIFSALCRELTGTSSGELSRTCAEDVLKRYSIAFFEAARRKKAGVRAGFPRRKRGLIPARFRWGGFSLDGSRVRLGVARGAPEPWLRLAGAGGEAGAGAGAGLQAGERRPATAAGSARPTARPPSPSWPGWWSTRWAPWSSAIPRASRQEAVGVARTWRSATGGALTCW